MNNPIRLYSPDEHAECSGHVAWLDDRAWGRPDPVVVAYGCEDWQAHGHAELHADAGTVTDSPMLVTSGKLSEQEKQRRREIIRNNGSRRPRSAAGGCRRS